MNKENTVQLMHFIFRLSFGYSMMENGKFIFDSNQTGFFLQWFGTDLHFPHPLLMYYLAKGSEFFGGLLLFIGLFTRIAAAFIAFTMLVATLTANVHHIYSGDGAITLSFLSFAVLFILLGPGKWSLSYLFSILKHRFYHLNKNYS
jgi:putative oxidoreductase